MRQFLPSVRWFSGQRSAIAFAVALALAMMAIAFPEMPPQLLLGMLSAGAGLLFLLFPPVARLPLVWWALGLGFLGLSLAGFMPRGWMGIPGWRQDLEALGLDTGPRAIVQARLAAESLCGTAVIALLGLFLLGHRVDSRIQRGLALAFVIFCSLWVLAALMAYHPGGEEVFGFFPNRNHTATLLAMAVLAAWGCLMHAITHKHMAEVAVSAAALLLFVYVILTVSISRAGVLLVAVGILGWLPLAGMRYLRGDTGKAVLLLIFGLVVGLLGIDTPVKQRLTASFAMDGTAGAVTQDARIGIQRDALGMIAAEPWCGVGPGQFVWIFPQYRRLTPVSSETPCLYPESDWLMVATEHGWPAALCLAAGVGLVFVAGFRAARHGHSRALRMACMVAALLLAVHGLLDIPGHREGLALAALLLLAFSLRPLEHGTTRGAAAPSGFAMIGWRVAGLALAVLGAVLLQAQWSGRLVLPSVIAKAGRQVTEQLPGADPGSQLLERARIDRAAMIAPLDPSLQFARGEMALRFKDDENAARYAFAIQRRLEPQQGLLLLKQAATWGKRDPARVKELWELALQHAAVEEQRLPETQHAMKNIYEGLFTDAAANPDLAPIAFEFAGHDFVRLEKWIRYTPAAMIDRYFPQLPADKLSAGERGALLAEWSSRGSPPAVEDFKRQHPEFATSTGRSSGK